MILFRYFDDRSLVLFQTSFSSGLRAIRGLAEQHMVRRPQTPMAAQYSLPYTVVATLAYGPERFDAFESSNLSDPRILAWADCVFVEPDPELEAFYPAHFGTDGARA
jgi:2-methylcitrate dehydratase PrpD